MTTPLITSRTDWSKSLILEIWEHIEDVALNDLKLNIYPNQIEIISAEQMLDAYSSSGIPVNYNHWSFGKHFLKDWQNYQKGRTNLALEIVINSSPCISYLMEENNAVAQTLVMAHAACGHNHVFKNNYLFKEQTNAAGIIDYMLFAKNYIKECESKYGEDEVERVLDAAHSLSLHAIDKRKKKYKKKLSEEEIIIEKNRLEEEERKHFDIILKKTALSKVEEIKDDDTDDLELVGDEENLVYFIYKNAPNMERWKREILRIVYKIQSYFVPNRRTKVLNEGFATFTHYYIMNELENRGLISPDAQIAWLQLHSGVLFQPDYNSKYYSGFNPYTLGFNILKEVRRVCENPTDEDKEWFPKLVGSDWRTSVKEAIEEYDDESFIQQFMTPKLIRDWRLFSIDLEKNHGVVSEISDELGYRNIRSTLAQSYNLINYIPDIVVHSAKMRSDRTLILEYRPFGDRTLYKNYCDKTLKSIKYLWGFDVQLIQNVKGEMVEIGNSNS